MRRATTAAVGGAAIAALAVVVAAALSFPTAAVAPTTRQVELPQELEHLIFFACLPGLDPGAGDADTNAGTVTAQQGLAFSTSGSGPALSVRIEEVGDWSVSVDSIGATMRVERPSDSQARTDAIAAAVTPTARSLYNCMAPYRFAAHAAPAPRSSAQLLQLYRYDTAVLWPCLRSQGIDVGDPPSRDQFTSSSSAVIADPLSVITLSKKSLPRLVPALRACPLWPPYLS